MLLENIAPNHTHTFTNKTITKAALQPDNSIRSFLFHQSHVKVTDIALRMTINTFYVTNWLSYGPVKEIYSRTRWPPISALGMNEEL